MTGGVSLSAAVRKNKRKAGRRAAAGEGSWAGGPTGQNEGEVLFPFFLFQTLLKLNLFNSNSIKTFQTFSQNFINLLDLTQATKNHA
jgi:hypothetical protein